MTLKLDCSRSVRYEHLRQMPKIIQLSAVPTAEITAMVETVTPAAINPDSIPLVVFAKRIMELLMVLPPGIEEHSFTGVKLALSSFRKCKIASR